MQNTWKNCGQNICTQASPYFGDVSEADDDIKKTNVMGNTDADDDLANQTLSVSYPDNIPRNDGININKSSLGLIGYNGVVNDENYARAIRNFKPLPMMNVGHEFIPMFPEFVQNSLRNGFLPLPQQNFPILLPNGFAFKSMPMGMTLPFVSSCVQIDDSTSNEESSSECESVSSASCGRSPVGLVCADSHDETDDEPDELQAESHVLDQKLDLEYENVQEDDNNLLDTAANAKVYMSVKQSNVCSRDSPYSSQSEVEFVSETSQQFPIIAHNPIAGFSNNIVNNCESTTPVLTLSDESNSDDQPISTGRNKKKRHALVINDTDTESDETDTDAEEAEFILKRKRHKYQTNYGARYIKNFEKSWSPDFVSDFDKMRHCKKAERHCANAHRPYHDAEDDNNTHIKQLISFMEEAAADDRELNRQGLPATKKLALIKYVAKQFMKKDLQASLLEHNILNIFTDWLSPLPNKSLPCLQLRDTILRLLENFVAIDTIQLKRSGLGKVVMYLSKHPDETKPNRERCERLIAEWARPIFDLPCDYTAMSKEERQQRDIELSQRQQKPEMTEHAALHSRSAKSVALVSTNSANSVEDKVPGPGEQGWVPRARVPVPSMREYVQRPPSQMAGEVSAKTKPNRYEVFAKKFKKFQRANKTPKSCTKLKLLG